MVFRLIQSFKGGYDIYNSKRDNKLESLIREQTIPDKKDVYGHYKEKLATDIANYNAKLNDLLASINDILNYKNSLEHLYGKFLGPTDKYLTKELLNLINPPKKLDIDLSKYNLNDLEKIIKNESSKLIDIENRFNKESVKIWKNLGLYERDGITNRIKENRGIIYRGLFFLEDSYSYFISLLNSLKNERHLLGSINLNGTMSATVFPSIAESFAKGDNMHGGKSVSRAGLVFAFRAPSYYEIPARSPEVQNNVHDIIQENFGRYERPAWVNEGEVIVHANIHLSDIVSIIAYKAKSRNPNESGYEERIFLPKNGIFTSDEIQDVINYFDGVFL